MKSSHPADARSAPNNYAPSVPMTVYRELAAELRANKAVIDSLNSRNQQLLNQNQMLKQEIHNVVQATLSLGQAAGVARQASVDASHLGFSGAVPEPPSERTAERLVPSTLARLARGESQPAVTDFPGDFSEDPYKQALPTAAQAAHYLDQLPSKPQAMSQNVSAMPQVIPQAPRSPNAAPATARNRVPRPIVQKPAQPSTHKQMSPAAKSVAKEARNVSSKNAIRQSATKPRPQPSFNPTEAGKMKGAMAQPTNQKLFTERSGEYRSTALDASEDKEIGGIWLVLSIVLIIVTAFGAGFLIMKPLLNDR
jgi:hypothetical protein